MSAKKMKYTVFLIKDEYETFEAVVNEEKCENKFDIREKYGVQGSIFLGHNDENEPDWYKTLKKGVQNPPDLFNMSTRAVMLLKRKNRIFAFTYGHGKHLIQPEAYVRGFGMRIVVNNCEVSKLKSLDSSTIDTVTVQARTQTSKSSEINAFQVDDARDMLKAVTAEAKDFDRYGKVISGRDAFHFTHDFAFEELKYICDHLLEDYASNRYKTYFGWIDHLNEVTDPKVKSQLEEQLVSQINNIYFTEAKYNLHMAQPEIIDMEDGILYSYKGNAQNKLDDIDLHTYIKEKKPQKSYTINKLKNDRVYVFNGNEEEIDRWPIYNCLVTEIEMEDSHYVLSLGQWYIIDQSYVTTVNKEIEAIATSDLELIDYNHSFHKDEKGYNEAVAEYNESILCMDRANINIENGKFEFCDLLSIDKHLIHVKPWRSSSTLSHLFSQGRISAESLVNISGLVAKVNKKIEERGGHEAFWLNDDRINPQEYTVVYAIIYEGEKEIHERLPFFSKLNLMHSVRTLRNMQFNVEKIHVKRI